MHSAPTRDMQPGSAAARNAFVPEIVIAQSRAVLSAAYPDGLPPGCRLMTTSPSMLLDPHLGAEALDGHLDPARLQALFEASLAVSSRAHDIVAASAPELALTAARSGIRMQRLFFSAACISPEITARRIEILEPRTGSNALDGRFGSPLGVFLEGTDRCRVRFVPVDAPSTATPPEPGLLRRLRSARPAAWVYKTVLGLGDMAERLGPAQIYIARDCELLRETAAWLALRGLRVASLPRVETVSTDCNEAGLTRLVDAVVSAAEEFLAPLLPEETIGPVKSSMREELFQIFIQFQREFSGWHRLLSDRRSRRAPTILSNVMPSPKGEALYEACKSTGTRLILFQHGVTAEICPRIGSMAAMLEGAACDGFVAFNPAMARCQQSGAFNRATPWIAGAPKGLGSRADPRRDMPALWYVSTTLYTGNVGLMHKGVTDLALARQEIALIDDVLARLPHRVLFKPYPAMRYLDPDPILGRIDAAENIELETRTHDLRYMIGEARVLITSHATSTFGWAMMSGRPVVYVEKPGEVPLDQNLKERLKDAIFLFELSDEKGLERMRELLSQPLGALEHEWNSMAERRKDVVREYFDAACGRGGGLAAAREILQELRTLKTLGKAPA